MTMSDHISRAWGEDPFAPECGCEKLPCGHVSMSAANEKGCAQHSIPAFKTIRSNHPADKCPGGMS
jgi:hypothetical protein